MGRTYRRHPVKWWMVGENDRVTAIPPRLRPLLDPASPVQGLAGRLVARGHRCYLVGGSVRDALLDVSSDQEPDVDVATDARPDRKSTRLNSSHLGISYAV